MRLRMAVGVLLLASGLAGVKYGTDNAAEYYQRSISVLTPEAYRAQELGRKLLMQPAYRLGRPEYRALEKEMDSLMARDDVRKSTDLCHQYQKKTAAMSVLAIFSFLSAMTGAGILKQKVEQGS